MLLKVGIYYLSNTQILIFMIFLIFNHRHRLYKKKKITPKQKLGAKDWIQTIRKNSFFSVGPRLYNSLPQRLRELEDIHTHEKKHTITLSEDWISIWRLSQMSQAQKKTLYSGTKTRNGKLLSNPTIY